MPKIIGDTTATPNPRPDWNQTDETKSDYIKNKPLPLIIDHDPTVETEGYVGQLCINTVAATAFICTSIADSSYVWRKIAISVSDLQGMADVLSAASVQYAKSAGSAETAAKATQDADGNVIASTYVTKSEFESLQATVNELASLLAK